MSSFASRRSTPKAQRKIQQESGLPIFETPTSACRSGGIAVKEALPALNQWLEPTQSWVTPLLTIALGAGLVGLAQLCDLHDLLTNLQIHLTGVSIISTQAGASTQK